MRYYTLLVLLERLGLLKIPKKGVNLLVWSRITRVATAMAASVYSVTLESNHAYICHAYEEALSTLARFDQTWRSGSAIKRHLNRDEADAYLHHNRYKIIIFERISGGGTDRGLLALTPLQRAKLRDGASPAQLSPQLPSSLLMDVDIKHYPRFDIELLDASKVRFVAASGLTVRAEWRNVSVRRIQIACVLIEALQSDFGKMTTIVRSPSRDLATCMHRYIHTWRRNQGRNARNQEVVGFAILDTLKKVIDGRKLSLFSPLDPAGQQEHGSGAGAGAGPAPGEIDEEVV